MYLRNNSPASALVVFDIYGTLLDNPRKTNPFSQLRQIIEQAGVDVSDYPRRAMTMRHTLSSLAMSYGVEVELETLARLEEQLMEELLDIGPFADVERTLRYVVRRGAKVVVASNLAWPYCLPVKAMLDTVMGAGGISGQISTAYSFEVGHIKPEVQFYSHIHDHFAQKQPEGGSLPIFMVGDRQQEDVEGPTRAGWDAWRVDRVGGQGLLDGPWDQWLG